MNRFFISTLSVLFLVSSLAHGDTVCKDGTYGEKCEYKRCTGTDLENQQCRFDGVCLKHIKTGKFKCDCKTGYSGALCEKPICIDYCYNDGKCKLDINNKKSCICPSRFSGERCQFDKCFEKRNDCGSSCYMNSKCECLCKADCDYNYCNKNKGTCFNDNGELGCKCKVGYSGSICSVDDCKGYCFNNGICHRNKTSIYCICPEGYQSDKRCGVKDSILVKDLIMKKNEKKVIVPTEFRSTRIIMYALSITLFICLISVGGYFAIQRGMFTFLLTPFDLKTENSPTASYSRRSNVPFTKNGFNFSKLEEDERSFANSYSDAI